MGHNGSGKTTLLRALSGAYEPDEGTIEVQGRIAPLLDLNLGIDPSATGYDNIKLRGRIAGLSSREVDARMDEIAEFTGPRALPRHRGEDLFRGACRRAWPSPRRRPSRPTCS